MKNRSEVKNMSGEDTKWVVVYLHADIVSEGFKTKRQAERRYNLEKEFDSSKELELLSIEDFKEKYQK